ncbi:MAG: hypothetical protein CL609_03065 [Anaerolineaceae bacterium]|nr:hypothetical protein [Anaerolineaceae bacterium]
MNKNWKIIFKPFLIWFLLAVLSIFFFNIFGNLAQDDAFITFRYAKNIASGYGFVYNNGEWVLGTTTPLYTLVLAVVAFFSNPDILRISIVINTISLWLAAGFLYEMVKSFDKQGAIFISFFFITSPFLRNFVGMESYFMLFLLILTVYLYRQKISWVAGVTNGLLVLVRYEMIFLSLLFFLWEIWKKKKFPYWMVPGGILVLGWIIYATLVFGSPIPLSASAKLIAPKHSFLLGGAAYLYLLVKEYPAAIIMILFALAGLLSLVKKRDLKKEYGLILLFSFLYTVAAALTAGAFPWYYAPLLPGFSVLVLLGINTFSNPKIFFTPQKPHKKNSQIKKTIRIICFVILISIQLFLLGNSFVLTKDQFGDSRYAAYKQIADYVRLDSNRQATLASFEIGYLGYFSNRYIIDIAGLVTPGLLPWVDEGAEKTLYHAIRLYSPDYVVIPCQNQKQSEIIEDFNRYQLKSKYEKQFCLYEKLS